MLLIFSAIFPVSPVWADLVDFEDMTLGDLTESILTPTNAVTFSGTDGLNTFISEIGSPTTAFQPNDTPAWEEGGQYFLSAPNESLGYSVSFEKPVSDISLYLYDFRDDGGAHVGDQATLTAYSSSGTVVGTDIFTVTGKLPDGNVEFLSVGEPAGLIYSAELSFSHTDGGTGIDNVGFTSSPVPIPGTLLLLGSGLLGLAASGKRLRNR